MVVSEYNRSPDVATLSPPLDPFFSNSNIAARSLLSSIRGLVPVYSDFLHS